MSDFCALLAVLSNFFLAAPNTESMYRCARWEAAKHKLQHYRRREPQASALYQAVYHGRDKLPLVWEDRFQSRYGVLRREVLEAYDAYLNCGLVQHGAAISVTFQPTKGSCMWQSCLIYFQEKSSGAPPAIHCMSHFAAMP